MFKAWQRITLWKRVIIGMLIGVAIGLTLRYGIGQEYSMSIPNFMPGAETDSIQFKPFDFGVSLFKPLGDAFVRLIKMLVIPLVFTTLVAGVTAMGDPKKLGSLGSKTIALYLLTTLFAVSLGLAIGTIVKPGKGVNYQANQGKTVEEIQEILEDEEQVKQARSQSLTRRMKTETVSNRMNSRAFFQHTRPTKSKKRSRRTIPTTIKN